jgi:hypothetical protein
MHDALGLSICINNDCEVYIERKAGVAPGRNCKPTYEAPFDVLLSQ